MEDEGSGKSRGNDIQTETQGSKAPDSAYSQQTCQPDIHAVLRGMTAMLTEQRLEITFLKREIKAQAAAFESLTARSNITESEVEILRRENEGNEAKRVGGQKTVVNMLKTDHGVRKVAFSASLLGSGACGTTGPYNAEVILVYRHVFSIIGNAYNSNTGFFTAPVKGVYQFQFYLGAHGHNSYHSSAALVKNGQQVLIAYSHHTSPFGKASNGVSVLLEVGDVSTYVSG